MFCFQQNQGVEMEKKTLSLGERKHKALVEISSTNDQYYNSLT